MSNGLFLAALIAALIGSWVVLRKNLHMFQLNTYGERTQLNWLVKNAKKALPQALVLGFALLSFFLSNPLWQIGLILTLVLSALTNLSKKAKKPLVYTARLKRLLCTTAILFLLPTVFSFFASTPANFLILGLAFFALPFLLLLANLINAPIEQAIRAYYTRDAKRLLDAMPNLTVIGITGSYGKTSVKYYLSALLSSTYNVLMTPESFNTPMGIVKTIRGQLRPTHEIFVCEMGAKKVGEIKELCDIVSPDHGVITSIGPQHLETFKSLDNIIKTKLELSDAIPDGGLVFLNGMDEAIAKNMPKRPTLTYGLQPGSSVFAQNVQISSKGTTFSVLESTGEPVTFQTQLIGEHNVVNLVGAIAVCKSLGIPLARLVPYVRKITPAPHRLQILPGERSTIIDDSYNSNPMGCVAALKTLALFEGSKILVTPGMVELGEKQHEYNFEFGTRIAEVCDFVALVGEEQTKPIYEGLLSKHYNPAQIYIAATIQDAMHKVNAWRSDRHKVILLENDLPDNY